MMKNLLQMCLLCLVLIYTVHAQEVTSPITVYELDAKATASAPWKVGEVIPNTTRKVYITHQFYIGRTDPATQLYRKFLGITTKGYYLVQDFYEENQHKFTEPYALINREEVDRKWDLYSDQKIDGYHVRWHLNGQQWLQILYVDGKRQGQMGEWSRSNGEKESEDYDAEGIKNELWRSGCGRL